MNRILVEVYFPAAERTYDVFFPLQLPLYKVVLMLKKVAPELSAGVYLPDNSSLLCRREDGSILNMNLTVAELGLKNSSKLMMI